MTSLIVGRLHVSFDRGTRGNKASDLGLETRPTRTEAGGLVRGLGTHYRSEEARAAATVFAKEEARIRNEFRMSFVSSPLLGVYILPERGAGRALLETLNVDPAVGACVSEYELGVSESLPPVEIAEWAARVKRQITDVPLGKAKYADEGSEGLVTLEKLAECPVLDDETSEALLRLIAAAKLRSISRVELKRAIADIDVQVNFDPIAPRRVKAQEAIAEAEGLSPKRVRKQVKVASEENKASEGAA